MVISESAASYGSTTTEEDENGEIDEEMMTDEDMNGDEDEES